MRKIISVMVVICVMSPGLAFSKEKAPTEEELAAAHVRISGQANAFLAKELGVPLAAIRSARDMDYPFTNTLFFAVVLSMAKGEAKMKDVIALSEEGLSSKEICERYSLDYVAVVREERRIFRKMRDAGLEAPYLTEKEWNKLFTLRPK